MEEQGCGDYFVKQGGIFVGGNFKFLSSNSNSSQSDKLFRKGAALSLGQKAGGCSERKYIFILFYMLNLIRWNSFITILVITNSYFIEICTQLRYVTVASDPITLNENARLKLKWFHPIPSEILLSLFIIGKTRQ